MQTQIGPLVVQQTREFRHRKLLNGMTHETRSSDAHVTCRCSPGIATSLVCSGITVPHEVASSVCQLAAQPHQYGVIFWEHRKALPPLTVLAGSQLLAATTL